MVSPDDPVNWKKFNDWVNMKKADQQAFHKSRCGEGETYCIFCEKVLKIRDCMVDSIEDGGEAQRCGHSQRKGLFCPTCYEQIHDYWL